MRQIEAALFDFGNTLFGHEALAPTIVRLSTGFGRRLSVDGAAELATEIDAAAQTPDELTHPRDLDAEVWQARWTVLYRLADRVVPGLGDALLADMHDPARWVPYASTIEVLTTLRARRIAIGIVSNTGWDISEVFDHHGVGELIDGYTVSYRAGTTKPDPRIFTTACATLHVDPSATLMVGDDPRADSGAVDAGLRVLLVPAAPMGTDNGIAAVLDLCPG